MLLTCVGYSAPVALPAIKWVGRLHPVTRCGAQGVIRQPRVYPSTRVQTCITYASLVPLSSHRLAGPHSHRGTR
jgi:hypothetical protein